MSVTNTGPTLEGADFYSCCDPLQDSGVIDEQGLSPLTQTFFSHIAAKEPTLSLDASRMALYENDESSIPDFLEELIQTLNTPTENASLTSEESLHPQGPVAQYSELANPPNLEEGPLAEKSVCEMMQPFPYEDIAALCVQQNFLSVKFDPSLKDLLSAYILEAIHRYDPYTAQFLAHSNNALDVLCQHGYESFSIALSSKNVLLLEICLGLGLDLNQYNKNGNTLLLEAVHHKDAYFVERLLRAGADSNIAAQYYIKRTPAIAAYYSGNASIQNLLPLSKHEKSSLAFQEALLGFSLEATELDFVYNGNQMCSHLGNLAENPEIKAAFLQAANSDRNLLQELSEQAIVMISSGTKDHNIGLVIGKVGDRDFLAVCQRGGYSKPSISYFPIDRRLFTTALLDQLSSYIFRSIDDSDALTFFYSTLPSTLSSAFDLDDFITQVLLSDTLQCKLQKCGNCIVASTKAAAAAMIAMQTFNQCSGSCSLEQMQHIAKVRYKKEIGLPLRLRLKEQAEAHVIDFPQDARALFEAKLKKYQEKLLKLEQEHA